MIRVGDEVVYCGGDSDDLIAKLMLPDDLYKKAMTSRFVVTKVFDYENRIYICGFDADGFQYNCKDADYWRPTGRHFPEVQELINKMGGYK